MYLFMLRWWICRSFQSLRLLSKDDYSSVKKIPTGLKNVNAFISNCLEPYAITEMTVFWLENLSHFTRVQARFFPCLLMAPMSPANPAVHASRIPVHPSKTLSQKPGFEWRRMSCRSLENINEDRLEVTDVTSSWSEEEKPFPMSLSSCSLSVNFFPWYPRVVGRVLRSPSDKPSSNLTMKKKEKRKAKWRHMPWGINRIFVF